MHDLLTTHELFTTVILLLVLLALGWVVLELRYIRRIIEKKN